MDIPVWDFILKRGLAEGVWRIRMCIDGFAHLIQGESSLFLLFGMVKGRLYGERPWHRVAALDSKSLDKAILLL